MRVDESKEEEDEYVFPVAGEAQGGKLTVNIGGIPLEMVIDSGASADVICQEDIIEQVERPTPWVNPVVVVP